MGSPAAVTAAPAGAATIKDPVFDWLLIGGPAGLAAVVLSLVYQIPSLFGLVLVANIWVLGYHHVIATFTRIAVTASDRRARRFELYGLPLLVAAFVIALSQGVGLWTIGTIYLYWQWFHYTRQSWGVSRAVARASETPPAENKWLAQAAFYLPPLWGILERSTEGHATFLAMPVKLLALPSGMVDAVGLLAALALALWVVERLARANSGEHALKWWSYMAIHHFMFFLAYRLTEDITVGRLALNIWHNTQYLLFVWMANRKSADRGQFAEQPWFERLCGPRRAAAYAAVLLTASTIIYASLTAAVSWAASLGLMASGVVIYQVINFHHYIVDGVIWARQRPKRSAQAPG